MIEVIRIMRYQYATPERMVEDMARWTIQGKSHDMRFDSTVLPPTMPEDIDRELAPESMPKNADQDLAR